MERTIFKLHVEIVTNNKDAPGDLDDSAIFVLGNELPKYFRNTSELKA